MKPSPRPSPRARRVLVVIHGATFGGPCNELATLASTLPSKAYEFTALLPDEHGSAPDRLRSSGVEVLQRPMVRFRRLRNPVFWAAFPFRFLRDVSRIARVIRDCRADLVHGYGINLQAAFAAALARRPLVWSLIDIGAPRHLRWLVTRIVRRLAVVVLLDGASMARSYPGIAGGRASVVDYYPPVDLSRFFPAGAQTHVGVVVGGIANINPDKGLEDLVAAAEIVIQQGLDARFEVTGGRHATHHALAVRLEARASLIPQGRFRFLPETADVPARLAGMDIFAISSRAEGTTTTALEAMASGLPVVATAVGGLPEVVEDGFSGVLVPPRQPEAFAQAILRLGRDPAMRARMGARGREVATARFDGRQFVRTVEDSYRASLSFGSEGA